MNITDLIIQRRRILQYMSANLKPLAANLRLCRAGIVVLISMECCHSLATKVLRLIKESDNHKATGMRRVNTDTKPVKRDASVKQTTIEGPYSKSTGCITSCGLRLPKRTEATAARLIKHIGCKFAKGLRLVMTRRKKKGSPQSKVSSSSSSSRPSIIMPISNEIHRSEAIEDCIEFINSSSSFTRSNSTS